jgi:hypothetical protein
VAPVARINQSKGNSPASQTTTLRRRSTERASASNTVVFGALKIVRIGEEMSPALMTAVAT